jgi:serine/threonine-protein kinase
MTAKPHKPDLTDTSPVEPGTPVAAQTPAGGLVHSEGSKSGSVSGNVVGGSRGAARGVGPGDGDAKDKTRSGNLDTFIAKMVVDQGFSTSEEVQHCLEMARLTAEEANQRSVAELLVENSYITRRQLERLRRQIEEIKSGQQIPGYKLLEKLGAGAMATVYKARQLSLDRLVAIKILPRKFSQNTQFIERFYAEGRAAAQLNHPNVVQAYDVGQAGNFHFFVMEFVDGRTVYDDIIKFKKVPERDAVEVSIQVAEALVHAHEKGLIHRDVKPKNIMLTKTGVVKLADLGLARAVSDVEAANEEKGKAFGTPYYISPEQIRGEVKIGPPADIYSLGATLYHMVTGQVPFDGKDPAEVMHQHLKSELRHPDQINPKLSAGVCEVIEMMMAKDARRRYQTCKDVLVDLRAVREGKQPPIAHKDVVGDDLAALAKAEQAAAVSPVVVEKSHTPVVDMRLFIVMCVLLIISVLVNLVMLLT